MKTNRLERYVEKIKDFYFSRKRMPSYSEMLKLFGFKSKNAVYRVIKKLIDRKILAKDKSGKIVPLKPFGSVNMLGYVSAGFPSPAEEELKDAISINEYLISNPGATYVLKVDGDSMIEAGIMPNDLVLVQKGRDPSNGDIVIAQVDGEWTMKYYYKKARKLYLKPGNKKYPIIYPEHELNIAGIVIGNIRKYK